MCIGVFIPALLKKLMWLVEVHVDKLFCHGQSGWLYFLHGVMLGREAGVINLSLFFGQTKPSSDLCGKITLFSEHVQ